LISTIHSTNTCVDGLKWETAKPAQPKGSHMDSDDDRIILFLRLNWRDSDSNSASINRQLNKTNTSSLVRAESE
jgi:hypothetical protein